MILGIDIGKQGGYVVYENNKIYESGVVHFESLKEIEAIFKDIIRVWKPEVVVTGKPNRMYNIVLRHAQFIGVLGLLCETKDISLVMVNDCTARALILGKGNGMKKELVHQKYQLESPDVSDAALFCEWYEQSITNEHD